MWPTIYKRFFNVDFPAPKPAEQRGTSLANTEGIAKLLGLPLTASAVPVTDRSILGLSPAWAAIRYISETVAAMPIGVYSWDAKNEGYDSRTDHPVNSVVSSRPHPHYSKFDFFQALIANACLGNGYARIHRDASFQPVALELIPPRMVTVDYSDDGSMLYKISGERAGKAVEIVLYDFEMIHIKGVTFNGAQGERISLVHRDNISSSLAAQQYTDTFFRQGAHISGTISTDLELNQEQRENAREAFRDSYGGLDKVGTTAILDMGLKYNRVGLTPQEAALVDFRKLSAEESSRIFKVPMHMLSSLDRSAFSNIEQQSLEFRQYTLPTWTEKVEQECNYKLFSKIEFQKRRAFVMFDYTHLNMADTDSMSKLISSGVQNGVFTGNMFRKWYKQPKHPDGDRLYIQRNLVPVDRVDDTITPADSAGSNTDEKDGNTQASAGA
mgnify:CR=1 FL=1